MEIHLVSSLTPDDESKLAPAMLAAIGRILETLPVSYSVRIETTTGNSIQHSRTAKPPTARPGNGARSGPEVDVLPFRKA